MNPTWINKTEHKNGNDYLPSKSGEGGKNIENTVRKKGGGKT